METLYVIGNGFDLHHKLDTSYTSFGFFLQEHNDEIYELLVEYFDLPDISIDNPSDRWNPLWSNFEAALATMDYKSILDDKLEIPNYGSDDFREADRTNMEYSVGEIVDNLTINLKRAFTDFIRKVVFPVDIEDLRLIVNPKSIFLQFNYTDTLERYYGIKHDNICYVHNSMYQDELILGHGVDPKSFEPKEKKPPTGLTDDEFREWQQQMAEEYDYSFDLAEQRVLGYYTSSHKSTNEIITSNKPLFEALDSIKDVFILGHSLGDVDMPYFESIMQSINIETVNWTVSYYSDGDKAIFFDKLIRLGVPSSNINMLKLTDLIFKPPTLF